MSNIDKVEPNLEQLFFNQCKKRLEDIQRAIIKAEQCLMLVKNQVDGAITSHAHSQDLPTLRLTIEHLKFVQQELDAVPYKELQNDLRILVASMEKEMRDGNR